MTASESPGRLLTAYALPGLPEIAAGDDLPALIVQACRRTGVELRDGDVLAIASTVIAKAEGRLASASTRADRESLVVEQSSHLVAERRFGESTVQVVRTLAGPVVAGAGIDASHAAGGVLLLPLDPDASAEGIRLGLADRLGVQLAIVITDTAGRPWRIGQSDYALGAAGLEVLDDLRGTLDADGRPLSATRRAIADEIAAAGDLVKGKSTGLPVAVLRGIEPHLLLAGAGAGAAGLVQPHSTDWFRHGHVEAVRAALGVPVGTVEPPPISPDEEDLVDRVERAVRTAEASSLPAPGIEAWSVRAIAQGAVIRVTPSGLPARTRADWGGEAAHPSMLATLGLATRIQRLQLALGAEDLSARTQHQWEPDGRPAGCELHLDADARLA